MSTIFLKTVSHYLVGLGIFFSICLCANAQEAAVNKLAQAMTDSLSYLQLTEQQKPQVISLNTQAATSLVQLKQKAKDESVKGKALVQQVAATMKQRNEGLKKLLTPEQQKIFAQHQLQQLAELQTKIMTAQLDLTDAQVPQVHKINLEATGEMMEDLDKLKESKRKMQKARAAKAIKSGSAGKDKEMKKVLTAEQYAKYEKNKEEMQAALKEKMQEKKN